MNVWRTIKNTVLGPSVRKKSRFANDATIDALMQDPRIQEMMQGQPDREGEIRLKLKKGLESAYDKNIADYVKGNKSTKYLTPLLRVGGLGLDVLGDAMFYIFPGAGTAFKVWSFYAKNAADSVEMANYLYHNHEGYDLKRAVPMIAGEALVSRAAAATPFFLGSFYDFWRGKRKFLTQVVKKSKYEAIDEVVGSEVSTGRGTQIRVPAMPGELQPALRLSELESAAQYHGETPKVEPAIIPLRRFDSAYYSNAA